MRKTSLISLLTLIILFAFPTRIVFSAQQSAADLAALINDVRMKRGMEFLDEDGALSAAAQAQAEYLASVYGSNISGVTDWHVDQNGNDEYIRVSNAGYALRPGWTVEEIAYGGNQTATVNEAVTWWLNSSVHTNAIYNDDNVQIGAGIAAGDGYAYYVVIFGVQIGSGTANNQGVISTIPTTAITPKVAPVTVATPNEDGSVFHTVESGQALWSIAIAYDITIDQILALNNLDADAIIFEGQSLQVRAAFTPTPQPTETNTPPAPTRTPIPAQTARVINTPVATEKPSPDGFLGFDNQTMGLALILISGLGLVLIIIGNFAKGKSSKSQKKE